MVSGLVVAASLDLALGDPRQPLHPVRLMGGQAALYESRFNRGGSGARFWKGLALAVGLPLAWALGSHALLFALSLASPWAAFGASALLIYFCLGGRDMVSHALAVLRPLERRDLRRAREKVALIVGRDTGKLDASGVSRACLESVAESLSDGWVAPLFFAALGGAPAALAYKAVSTLDSMVGHRSPQFEDFGKASARLDDALNFIPARISALLLAFCALARGRFLASLSCAVAEGPRQPSPNSGLPEGAMAGALGVRLGGPATYGGRTSRKALLNAKGREAGARDIRPALLYFSGAALLALALMELGRALA